MPNKKAEPELVARCLRLQIENDKLRGAALKFAATVVMLNRRAMRLPPVSDRFEVACAELNLALMPNAKVQRRPASVSFSMKITQRQLEHILVNEGVIPFDAIEDPEGFDHGRIELAVSCAVDRINEILANDKIRDGEDGASHSL